MSKVIITGRNEGKLKDSASKLSLKGDASYVKMDNTRLNMFREILSGVMPFDILVNNAGYARWLGFKNIETGCNPSGWERFSGGSGCGARRFLFSGRFSPEKGLDFLFAAYAKYRVAVGDPWPLDLVGIGECLPTPAEGINVVGFVEPKDMPKTVRGYAALLLTSKWETWGISAMEAMSAGLSVIATDACGFTSDINPTVLVNSGDVDGLAAAMRRVHELDDGQRAAEGIRLQNEARRYSDSAWVDRFFRLMCEKSRGEE